MDFFFNPRSVAVVGASDKGPGSFLLGNLQRGYQGKVFPVNPNYQELGGLPCYPSVDAIPEPVDLALLLIPAKLAPETLTACVKRRVKGAIIQSAGFAEVGEKGQDLSRQALEIARQGGLRLWGPNCMGLVDVPNRRFFTLMQPAITNVVDMPGSISLVVQSGMLSAGFLADLMSRHSIGVAKVCSLGNKLDVDECDVLEYLMADPETKVVAMYLESLKRGRRFMELASSSPKPVVVLKGGVSRAGAKAALSHTASLAGNARLTSNMLAAAGVVQANDFHQMMDLALTLDSYPSLPPAGRAAVITFSGGAGILTCDLLERYGLNLAELSPATKQGLAEIFPPWMPPDNPVDLFPAMARMGRVAALERACEIVMADPGVDLVVFHHLIGVEPKEMDLAALKARALEVGKPVVFWGLGLEPGVAAFRRKAHENSIPVYGELSRLVECLAQAAQWQPKQKDEPIAGWTPEEQAAQGEQTVYDEHESKLMLGRAGVPVVKEKTANSVSEALAAARELGFPVVLKGLAPGVVHKTEMGMVRLNLEDEAKLEAAAQELLGKLAGQGCLLVQKQAPGDFELIVGFMRDAQFGPVIMVGLGGVLAELEPDVVFAPAPLSQAQALALLGRIRNQKLLNGFRGMAPLNRERMAGLLVSLGLLCAENSAVKQVDLNPVMICAGEPLAVDASVVST